MKKTAIRSTNHKATIKPTEAPKAETLPAYEDLELVIEFEKTGHWFVPNTLCISKSGGLYLVETQDGAGDKVVKKVSVREAVLWYHNAYPYGSNSSNGDGWQPFLHEILTALAD